MVSAQKMKVWLESHGVDMSQFEELGAYDEQKLRGMLSAKGLDQTAYEKKNISVGLDRSPGGLAYKLKGMSAERLSPIKEDLLAAQAAVKGNAPEQGVGAVAVRKQSMAVG